MEPPARLRRFDAADWPPEDGDLLDQWRDARSEYVRANGWWPGDELDELRERRDVILRYHSGRICPRLPRLRWTYQGHHAGFVLSSLSEGYESPRYPALVQDPDEVPEGDEQEGDKAEGQPGEGD
jgi:hypothetical protein